MSEPKIVDNQLIVSDEHGDDLVLYEPLPHQARFHASTAPNLLGLGTRGTGKSLMLRMDMHLRCLMVPNFRALIVRRTMPELRQSHLTFIDYEMKMLGGVFLSTFSLAKYPNGSTLRFAHCETLADVMDFLSSQYGAVGFDEVSTFELTQFLQISAAARAPVSAPYHAVVRAVSNTLGIGSEWMETWFVEKTVNRADYPDYYPEEFETQRSALEENIHIDRKAYAARLKNLPEHVRRSWLLGEFVREGAYFYDFRKTDDTGKPWHVIDSLPTLEGRPIFDYSWLRVYRAIDWGYHPDPAVCLWVAMLPNKRAIVFKERTWQKTVVADVAAAIKRESEGFHVVETFCDPTMFIKTGETAYSIGELFEQGGVPLTPSVNARELYGYAIHEQLNTTIDGVPKLQIVMPLGPYGCPELLRSLPKLRMDPHDSRKIDDGDDHWAVALAYFCMGQAPPSRPPAESTIRQWMRPHAVRPLVLG